jgi:hypothetical protein
MVVVFLEQGDVSSAGLIGIWCVVKGAPGGVSSCYGHQGFQVVESGVFEKVGGRGTEVD